MAMVVRRAGRSMGPGVMLTQLVVVTMGVNDMVGRLDSIAEEARRPEQEEACSDPPKGCPKG